MKEDVSTPSVSTMIDALSELRGLLMNPEITIVGSLALHLQGMSFRPVKDIDIEVYRPSICPTATTIISALVQSSNVKYDYKTDGSRLDFVFKGINVNMWIVDKRRETSLWCNYMKVATVSSVIDYKVSMGRKKDIRYLLDIAEFITRRLSTAVDTSIGKTGDKFTKND